MYYQSTLIMATYDYITEMYSFSEDTKDEHLKVEYKFHAFYTWRSQISTPNSLGNDAINKCEATCKH